MHYPKLLVCFMAHIIICIQGNPFSVRLSTCWQNEDCLTLLLNALEKVLQSTVLSLSLYTVLLT